MPSVKETRRRSVGRVESRESDRLTQYLDFVKLYTEVNRHKEADKAKKEANVIWKEKIEIGGDLSSLDYLEQLALLRSNKTGCPCPHRTLSGSTEIEFSCAGAMGSVGIAGTFNDWKPEPLKLSREDGDWSTTIKLSPGVYHYKYVVDGEWLHNPSHEFEEDGKGNINNVVRVEDKISSKIKEIREELEELKLFLSEPWKVESCGLNFCRK